jgi:hypothetical protein
MSQANHTKALASQDVGLIFVREYYTFLNKKPSRLYAFYNKDSLFVRGDEGANVTTAKGQDVKCFCFGFFVFISVCAHNSFYHYSI